MNKRALRVVLNDYTSSYPELLEKTKINSIYVQNIHVLMIECFKYINGINPNTLTDVFNLRNHNHNTRGTNMLQLPQVTSETHGINSFRYQVPKLWNTLPDEIKLARDVQEFKSKIKHWKPSCCCGSCHICRLYLV